MLGPRSELVEASGSTAASHNQHRQPSFAPTSFKSLIEKDYLITLDVNNAKRYVSIVIASFANSATEKVWNRERVSKWSPEVQRIAHRKLLIIDAADFLHDLRIPPGNRLEQLAGTRFGQHSIRVNDQWRLCFTWTPAGAENIELVDYH
ncbi:MAG: type II toxin-antitoxin system RelE/ParE family toxin [Rhodoluna sp.]